MLTAELIRAWIKHKNVDIKRFAEAIGFERATVSNWVNGNVRPSPAGIVAMAKYCGVTSQELSLGPGKAFLRDWNQAEIVDGDKRFVFEDREALVTTDRDERVGKYFINFVNTIVPYIERLNTGEMTIIPACPTNSFGDTLTLRELVRLCWQLNIMPEHLPLPVEAVKSVRKVLNELDWRPIGNVNAITCLVSVVDCFAEHDAVFYTRKRSKLARKSISYINELSATALVERVELLRKTQDKLVYCVSKKQLGAAINNHTLFHRYATTDIQSDGDLEINKCLRESLVAPTLAAINDSSFAAMSWIQHSELIDLLATKPLDIAKLKCWYAREHSIGTAAVLMHIDKIGKASTDSL